MNWPWGDLARGVWIIALGEAMLLTLPDHAIGPVIAATAALLIAFVAYPWQKRVDREHQTLGESREIHKRFFETAHRSFALAYNGSRPEIEAQVTETRIAFNNLVLYAPIAFLKHARKLVSSLNELSVQALEEREHGANELSENVLHLLVQAQLDDLVALNHARRHFIGASELDAVTAVSSVYQPLGFDAAKKGSPAP